MNALIVIPARLESKRLPRKLLLNETGKPLIQHTWEQAMKTGLRVIVATDSEEMFHVLRDGAGMDSNDILATSHDCRNGTERVDQIAERKEFSHCNIFICWQADEPDIHPDDVLRLAKRSHHEHEICTLAAMIIAEEAADPNRTKVAINDKWEAMYFSRSPIPYAAKRYKQHIGIYAYPRSILQHIVSQDPCETEEVEGLEQLRWLNHGHRILVDLVVGVPLGINTREDYDAFVERQKVMA